MERRTLLAELSQQYVRLGTLKTMSEVAGKLAASRKAVAEIRDIEDQLMAQGTTVDGLKAAMTDMAALAKVAARSAAAAIGLLKGMKPDMQAYLLEVERDAAS